MGGAEQVQLAITGKNISNQKNILFIKMKYYCFIYFSRDEFDITDFEQFPILLIPVKINEKNES